MEHKCTRTFNSFKKKEKSQDSGNKHSHLKEATERRKLSKLMSIIVNNLLLNLESPHVLPRRAPKTLRGTLSPDWEYEMLFSAEERERKKETSKRSKSFIFGCLTFYSSKEL